MTDTKLSQTDLPKDINTCTILQDTEIKRTESMTGNLPQMSSISDSKSDDGSVTGYDDMEMDETEQ
ncbi:hypothetical protein LOAG_14613 [Loa loa]|uniref:Uncharacterized protein n=1 Tax=Loa loa TaxID=7209 RepID=A0A1S0THH1_LOALO|nr:hypothetical protein LOAG_14613 [Loa loa]EFO13913.1 hypothetical protein LOAG_14613 [Loa loa]